MDLLSFLFRAALLFFVLYFGLWPLYAAYRFTRPPRQRVAFFTPTHFGVTFEEVKLLTRDNLALEGWYIPSRNRAAVILLHGFGSNRLMMVAHAEALSKAGYGVLMCDLRAHGNSEGKRFARSQMVVDDVLTAVAYLHKRPEINAAGIGVAGLSIGGLLALQAAGQTVAIRAVFTEGASPAVLADMPPPDAWREHVAMLVQRYYMRATNWFLPHEPLPANRTIIPNIAPRPLYFVSAGRGMERRMVRRYYEAAQPPKQIWEIPAANHGQGWLETAGTYEKRLVTFFDEALVSFSKSRIFLPDTADEESGE